MFLLYCELFQFSTHSCLCFIFVVVFNSLTRTGQAFRKYLLSVILGLVSEY